jgi:hypothetical protein
VGAPAVEHLVRADLHQVDAACCGRLGEDPDRIRVPRLRQVGVSGTAVDVGPRRRVDDHLRSIAIEQRVDGARRIEVEGVPGPRDRPCGSAEWCITE